MTQALDIINAQLNVFESVRNGLKEKAFRQMESYYREVLLQKARRLSLSFVYNDSDRIDAILKAFEDAYKKISAGEVVSNLTYYLFAFVKNNLRNTNKYWKRFYARRQPIEISLHTRGESDRKIEELNGTGDDRLHSVKIALGQLGEVCQMVIRLKKLEQKSHAEIVRQVPEITSSSASAKRLERCMDRLKKLIT